MLKLRYALRLEGSGDLGRRTSVWRRDTWRGGKAGFQGRRCKAAVLAERAEWRVRLCCHMRNPWLFPGETKKQE